MNSKDFEALLDELVVLLPQGAILALGTLERVEVAPLHVLLKHQTDGAQRAQLRRTLPRIALVGHTQVVIDYAHEPHAQRAVAHDFLQRRRIVQTGEIL